MMEIQGVDACQVVFCDGTVAKLPRGFYWREWIGPGHFGPQRGPFDTEKAAKEDFALNCR